MFEFQNDSCFFQSKCDKYIRKEAFITGLRSERKSAIIKFKALLRIAIQENRAIFLRKNLFAFFGSTFLDFERMIKFLEQCICNKPVRLQDLSLQVQFTGIFSFSGPIFQSLSYCMSIFYDPAPMCVNFGSNHVGQ